MKTDPLMWQCVVHLMISTGMRRGEVMGLKWDSIDFAKKEINVCNNLQYHPKHGVYDETPKNGRDRKIGVPDEVIEMLRQHKKAQSILRIQFGANWTNTGYCFTNEEGKPFIPSAVTSWLIRFSKRHGLHHIHPHAFRHTFASILIAKGTDPVRVSKSLGHSAVSITLNTYSHQFERASEHVTEVITNTFYCPDKKDEDDGA